MSLVEQFAQDFKLKVACSKIAEGIAELQNLGLCKDDIAEGLRRQLDAFYKEDERHD